MASAQKTYMVFFDLLFCAMVKKIKQHSTKNIPACTHLSKLKASSNLKLGMCLPGIEHNAKMIKAQLTDSADEYFKMNLFIFVLFA